MGQQSSAVCVAGSAPSARPVRHSSKSVDGGQAHKLIGVIGSRSLPLQYAEHVGAVVEDILRRKNQIASGGAVGTDEYCLAYLVHIGEADKCTVYSPWSTYEGFPVKVRVLSRQFKEYGGSIVWGNLRGQEEYAVVRAGLLARNMRLIDAVTGIVAFLHGDSNGTLFTLRKALGEHLPVVIFCIDRRLPEFKNIKWKPLRCGGCWDGAYKAVYLR